MKNICKKYFQINRKTIFWYKKTWYANPKDDHIMRVLSTFFKRRSHFFDILLLIANLVLICGSVQIQAQNPLTKDVSVLIQSENKSYPITPFVVGLVGQAGYQTIQSAINAAHAVGEGTVYIQPGIYAEDLILYDKVDLWGAVGVADTGACKIIGVHTPPLTGALTVRNIFLESPTHILSSAAVGTATIILIDAAVSVVNGYTFNLPNWEGSLVGFDIGEIKSSNDGWVNNTAGATIFMTNSTMGAGTQNPMILSGSVEIYDCVVQCPTIFQKFSKGIIGGGSLFQQPTTFSHEASFKITNSTFQSGNLPAVIYNSSKNSSIATTVIASTHDPAIVGNGSGSLTLSGISFIGNSNIANTLILATGTIRGGNFISQFVVGKAPDAQYQTIQSAIKAAHAAGGGTIYVHAGVYKEDLNLFDKIEILGVIAEKDAGNIQIVGTHTPPITGSVAFKNLQLNSATHIFNSLAAGTATITLMECAFNVTNGFLYYLPNWKGNLRINDANAIGKDDGIVYNTGGATLFFNNANLGAGSSQKMLVSGDARFDLTSINCPSIFTAGRLTFNVGFSTQPTSFSGNAFLEAYLWDFRTKDRTAITQNSKNPLTLKTCSIDSTAPLVIDGTGVVKFAGVDFTENDQIAKTIIQNFSSIYRTGTIQVGEYIDIVTVGGGINIAEGKNGRMGTVNLQAGTAVITTTAVTANSRIFLTSQVDTGTPGFLRVSSRTPGKNFTISSSSSQDSSTVSWIIFEPSNTTKLEN